MGFFDFLRRKSIPSQPSPLVTSEINSLKEEGDLNLPKDHVGPKGAFSGYRSSPTAQPATQLLSVQQLRDTYKQSPHIRVAVDTITQSIYVLPWEVLPIPGQGKVNEEAVDKILRTPNMSGHAFSDIVAKVVNDILVVNKGAIYVAPSLVTKSPAAIYARDGGSFKPVYDDAGILYGYKQYASQIGFFESSMAAYETPFSKDEIIFFDRAPVSYAETGEPLIEAIANAIAGLMRTDQRFAFYAKRGQFPPGFLHLGKIGEDAYERAKQQMTDRSNVESGLPVIDNVDEAQFHKLDDVLHATVLGHYQAAVTSIWVLFGLVDPAAAIQRPAESYDVDATAALASKSTLIPSIAQTIETRINEKFSTVFNGKFTYSRLMTLSLQNARLAKDGGFITPNEGRKVLGLDPKPGGDQLTALSPTGLTSLGKEEGGKEEEAPLDDEEG